MEKLSRVLAVTIAVLSVAFMGFAGVVSFGGPNWEAQARNLPGYTFTLTPGEPPIWSVTRADGREELPTKSALLPEVLAAAIKDRTERATAERDRLKTAIPDLEQQAQTFAKIQEQDLAALEAAFNAEMQRLAAMNREIDATSAQQQLVASEIRKIEDQIESRREDVFRLELEHQLMLADMARVDQNIVAVEEQIRLVEDDLDKANRRQQEFDDRGLSPAVRVAAVRGRAAFILRSMFLVRSVAVAPPAAAPFGLVQSSF